MTLPNVPFVRQPASGAALQYPPSKIGQVLTVQPDGTVNPSPVPGGSGGGFPAPAISRFIFVSPPTPDGFGSDVTGDGTMTKPVATIAHAFTLMTGASVSNTWAVILLPGTFVEDVALPPFVRLFGWDPSLIQSTGNPAAIRGSVGLAPGALWNDPNVQALIANIALIGVAGPSILLDYPSVSSSAGAVGITNCNIQGNVAMVGGPNNYLELNNCPLVGDVGQQGGQMRWCNVTNIFTNLIQVKADASGPTLFYAYGGSWAGDLEADQNHVDTHPVSLNLAGFATTGSTNIISSEILSPTINGPFGAIRENATLDLTAAMSNQMRISARLTVPSGTVIAGPGELATAAFTDITLTIPAALLGTTSIEQLQTAITLVEWQNLMVSESFTVTPTIVNGAGAEVHLIVCCFGAGFTTGFDLFVDFFGYLPTEEATPAPPT